MSWNSDQWIDVIQSPRDAGSDDGTTSGRVILVLDLYGLCYRMNQNVTKKILKIITRATDECCGTTVNKSCRQDLPTPHGMYN
jgi:hypothetical protein